MSFKWRGRNCANDVRSQRILLVANMKSDRQRSMLRYSEMLAASFANRGIKVHTVHPKNIISRDIGYAEGGWKWLGYFEKFVIFPIYLICLQRTYAWVHVCDHSNSLYRLAIFRRATITCHDIIAIRAARGEIAGTRIRWTGRIFQRLILLQLLRYERIFCVSAATAAELTAMAPQVKDSVSIVHNPLDELFFPRANWVDIVSEIVPARMNLKCFFLHVGSALPRKNREYVVELFAKLRSRRYLDATLLFVGPPPDPRLAGTIARQGLDGFVHFVENLSNDELAAIYSGALGLIFPSTHEGFGWPIIEAQACGCPVFASNIPPFQEIAESSATIISLDDPDRAAEAILSSDFADLSRKGLENSRRFSSAKVIDSMMKL